MTVKKGYSSRLDLLPSKVDDSVVDGALQVKTYERLNEYITKFAEGKIGLLLIFGGPGTGKSYAMREASNGKKVCWINNTLSAWGLYCHVFDKGLNRPIIIDDVDEIYRDRRSVAILKCLCQTDPRKLVTWNTQNSQIQAGDYPDHYTTRSTVCLIANDWRQININVAALESRGKLCRFIPSNEEIHKYVGTWFKDQEIYDWIGKHLPRLSTLTIRHYTQALEDKATGGDWKGDLLESWKPDPKREAIHQLFDPQGEYYRLDRDSKVKKWSEMIGGRRGGGRNAMYDWKKKFGYR
jgi:hypothetical protein